MSGRPGPDEEEWERPSSARRSPSTNGFGTEKHRALPPRPRTERVPRPSGAPRLEQSPNRRIARPEQRSPAPPRKLRRSLLLWGSIFLVCALLACVIGYAAFNYFTALNAAAAPTSTVTDFLNALQTQNYDQAYNDLSVTITLTLERSTFKQQAQADDRCYGPVTDYQEISGSAINTNNTWSFGYTITRSKFHGTYKLTLQLRSDPENPNTWRISDYGGELGPAHPSC